MPASRFCTRVRTRLPANLYIGIPPRRAPEPAIMREPKTASASPGQDRGDHVAQRLGRVLPVAVEHDGHVPAVVGGVAVAGLLVAAVAQVAGLAEHGQGQVGVRLAVALGHLDRVVRGRVVEDEDLGHLVAEGRGDAVEDGRDRLVGVVGDDEHTDLHGVPPAVPDMGDKSSSRPDPGRGSPSERPGGLAVAQVAGQASQLGDDQHLDDDVAERTTGVGRPVGRRWSAGRRARAAPGGTRSWSPTGPRSGRRRRRTAGSAGPA